MAGITEVEHLQDVKVADIIAATAADGFHTIRGLFDTASIRNSLARIRETISLQNDTPSAGARPEQIMNNFQKWSIGFKSPRDTIGRFFRIIYNPLWAEDIYGMHQHFIRLIELRNHLTEMPIDFCKQVEEGGLYSACRMQHYPRGGGFMQAHRDHVGEYNLVGSEQSRFIQVLLVLNEVGPGKDFEEGGAFVENEKGERIFTERNTTPGDVVIYDGRTIHGVEDIDPHKLLDLSAAFGRMAAFTTIYKKWN